MTPLRAAVLLAFEQECTARFAAWHPAHLATDAQCVRYGAMVSAISSRVEYPGLVRSSVIRNILHAEELAGRAICDRTSTAHRWWPLGLCDRLRTKAAS